MASQVPNQQNPMFAFDQRITQIYFRNDTAADYQIILVPKSTKFKDFPRRSICIDGSSDLKKSICVGIIVPGQCVKINKVRN